MLNKKVEGKAVLQLLCLKSLLLLEKFSLKTKFNIIHEQIGRNKWDLKNQEGDFLYFDNLKSPVKIERVSMSVNYSKPFFSTKNQLFHYSWFPEICQLQFQIVFTYTKINENSSKFSLYFSPNLFVSERYFIVRYHHMLGWYFTPYCCGEANLNINILFGLRLYDDVAAFDW